ncbi:hypothetical protein FKP32DRAFT_184964 [Trametes sanguinea]|nr:hypothetical protein FKP32DRAFT_184964 [Trametes sanguinea]
MYPPTVSLLPISRCPISRPWTVHFAPDLFVQPRLPRSSEDKWQDFEDEIAKEPIEGKGANYFQATMNVAKKDIVLQYTYPRLDAEVSKHRNHLLKAPFCVHLEIGRVCVPVDPRTIDNFDPASVPTVTKLLRELDSIAPTENGASGEHHSDWERTSLKSYVEMLDKHVMGLLKETKKNEAEDGFVW